ncbi:MAG: hypothetical protein QF713_02560 [Dehalococcoidales bacterium]|nr:hypothetical protein [Dehalococcoidales bacterium]
MAAKIVIGILLVFSMLLSACYPELSIQQYDKLRNDLDELDTDRKKLLVEVAELGAEREALQVELAEAKNRDVITGAYIDFLNQMVSTQSSEKVLTGEFDVGALIGVEGELTAAAEILEDGEIVYFLGLLDTENESQTVSAYYKVIEYCIKRIKQNLE